ncbi:TIM-barrel domain-containing protein [Occallatibacter savannae]|uniref:glycoside hydrolase family 31 protein n=1 Tax=Occallatibacter savannae TaxID=1002691 RepID=UPI000D691AE2|nr:TIM-barrel domain-containing protein [Occallatibacter savannae]
MIRAKCSSFAVLVTLLSAATAQLTVHAVAQPRTGSVRLERVTASHPLPNGIELRSATAIIQITALRDDVLRMRVGTSGQLPEDASWAVLPASRTATTNVTSESTGATVGFKTAKLHVAIHKDPFGINVTDSAGHVIIQDLPSRAIEFHGASFRVYMKSPEDEHYFGLGDKPGPLDRRSEAFTDWNTDAFGWQQSTDPIYKSIPWFITFRKGVCAGIFLDNTFRSSFEFNKEYRDAYSFGSEGGPLDFYLVYGPEPKQVLENWAWLVGTTPMPPMWALGYQQSRYSYYPEAEVKRIVGRLRSERIPADVIWLDIDFQYKNWPFTVDPERFPTFEQMIKDLRAEHIRTVVITDLHIADQPLAHYKPFDEGIAGDHFVKNPDGSIYEGVVWPGKAVFPDFTHKPSRDWWGTLYADFVKKGVAGFWNDMNEPAVFLVPSKTMPDDTQHRIEEPGFTTRTTNHLEVHNIFGLENSRGTFEGLLKLQPNLRPFVMTRASFAGGHRYAATWTGDNSSTWDHLRQTTPQIVNLGLSGFAMTGADVGGFAGSPQSELLTRWIEVAAFHPIDRDHTATGTNPQEPWENGTAEDVSLRRRYIEERYRLMPYLYTTTEEMSRTGLPIMRPLFMEFPHGAADGGPIDLSTGNAFMVGSDLLVAQSPYPDEVDDYAVALPPSTWYDYWTGSRIDPTSGRKGIDNAAISQPEVHIHRTLETLPIFVRAGSVIPEQPLVQSTEEQPQGPLTLRVYPPTTFGAECSGSLYLDDGISYDFKKGDFLRVNFACRLSAQGLIVTVAPREGTFQPWWKLLSIEVYGAAKPYTSASVTLLDHPAASPVTTNFDAEHHRVTALVSDDPKGVQLQLTY